MKKVFTLIISVVLVLALAKLSLATTDVKVSGEVNNRYDFTNEKDRADVKLNVDAKLNDSLSARLVYKVDTNYNVGTNSGRFNEYYAYPA